MAQATASRLCVHRVLRSFALTVALTGPAQAQQTDVWRTGLDGNFKRMTLTATGDVLVESDSGLAAYDPVSGSRQWSRLDASDYAIIEGTSLAVARVGQEQRVIDLMTGNDQWRLSTLPLADIKGYVPLPEHGLLLVIGRTASNGATVLAVSLDSGAVRWKQDSLFAGLTRDPAKVVLALHGTPLIDTDTTVILDADEAGLLKLRLSDGSRLWNVPDSLVDLDKLTAPLALAGQTLLVAYDKKLAAFDAATGALLWNRPDKSPGPIQQMAVTPEGVVVGGAWMPMSKQPRAFVDCFDHATGESRWTTALQFQGASPFLVRNDTVFSPVNKGFRALELATGKPLVEVSLLDFGGREEATTIETMPDGNLVLISAQNLMRVDPAGQVKYSVYLKAPGASLLAKFGAVALTVAASQIPIATTPRARVYLDPTGMAVSAFIVRYSATANTNRFVYIFTSELTTPESDSARAGGFDLVRIDKETGRESGRLRLSDRTPDYVLDSASGTVVVASGRELIAYRYDER